MQLETVKNEWLAFSDIVGGSVRNLTRLVIWVTCVSLGGMLSAIGFANEEVAWNANNTVPYLSTFDGMWNFMVMNLFGRVVLLATVVCLLALVTRQYLFGAFKGGNPIIVAKYSSLVMITSLVLMILMGYFTFFSMTHYAAGTRYVEEHHYENYDYPFGLTIIGFGAILGPLIGMAIYALMLAEYVSPLSEWLFGDLIKKITAMIKKE